MKINFLSAWFLYFDSFLATQYIHLMVKVAMSQWRFHYHVLKRKEKQHIKPTDSAQANATGKSTLKWIGYGRKEFEPSIYNTYIFYILRPYLNKLFIWTISLYSNLEIYICNKRQSWWHSATLCAKEIKPIKDYCKQHIGFFHFLYFSKVAQSELLADQKKTADLTAQQMKSAV